MRAGIYNAIQLRMRKRLFCFSHTRFNGIPRKCPLDKDNSAIGSVSDSLTTMSHSVNLKLKSVSDFKQCLLS